MVVRDRRSVRGEGGEGGWCLRGRGRRRGHVVSRICCSRVVVQRRGRAADDNVREVLDLLLQRGDLVAQRLLHVLLHVMHQPPTHTRDHSPGGQRSHAAERVRARQALHAQGGQNAARPRRAPHEDPQVLERGEVRLQAAVGALAAQVRGPQPQVLLADAEVDALDALGVRGGDHAEDVAVARVGEEELVLRVQDGDGLVVDLPVGPEQVSADVVLHGRLAGPPEGVGRGQGVGVDAVAQLAGQR